MAKEHSAECLLDGNIALLLSLEIKQCKKLHVLLLSDSHTILLQTWCNTEVLMATKASLSFSTHKNDTIPTNAVPIL